MRTKERMRLKRRSRLKSSTRVRRTWHPVWGPPIIGWTINYIRQNKWRCDPVLDTEDLLQDAYLVFDKIVSSYPFVTEPKHFMAMFKTALRNDVFDKARKEDKRLSCFEKPSIHDTPELEILTYSEGPLAALLSQSPELKLVLELFNDEGKLKELRKPLREKRGEPRDNFNMRLSKLIGLDTRTDLVSSIKHLLTA